MQQDGEDCRGCEEQHEFEGEYPGDVALAEIGKAFGVVAIGLVAEGEVGNTAEKAHRADRYYDRGQAKTRTQKPVQGAAAKARADAGPPPPRTAEARLHPRTHAPPSPHIP